jgi:hypothetical protein
MPCTPCQAAIIIIIIIIAINGTRCGASTTAGPVHELIAAERWLKQARAPAVASTSDSAVRWYSDKIN